jgi:hypothetical protein
VTRRIEAVEDIDRFIPDDGSMTQNERTVQALSLATSERDCDAIDAAKSGVGVRGGGKASGGFRTFAASIPTKGTPITDSKQLEEIFSNLTQEAAAEKEVAMALTAKKEKAKVSFISILL